MKISELDTNFAPLRSDETFDWFDTAPMPLQGSGWQNDSDDFCRLPTRVRGEVRDAIWELSRHSAGVALDFESDARALAVRWTLRSAELAMPHMPATGVSGMDLYARDNAGWRWMANAAPTETVNEKILASELDGAMRRYRLNWPLYNGVEKLELGIARGAALNIVRETRKPICFYGTSIVQGGCASRPGMAYPAIIERRLDWPTINLGFSGNALCEPEVAALLAELDPQMYVLDPMPNMEPAQVTERLGVMIGTLRVAHPTTPIVLVEQLAFPSAWQPPIAQRARENNAAMRAIFNEMRDANLQLVSGAALLGNDGEATVDGIHPTDLGFMRMADAIAPILKELLPIS